MSVFYGFRFEPLASGVPPGIRSQLPPDAELRLGHDRAACDLRYVAETDLQDTRVAGLASLLLSVAKPNSLEVAALFGGDRGGPLHPHAIPCRDIPFYVRTSWTSELDFIWYRVVPEDDSPSLAGSTLKTLEPFAASGVSPSARGAREWLRLLAFGDPSACDLAVRVTATLCLEGHLHPLAAAGRLAELIGYAPTRLDDFDGLLASAEPYQDIRRCLQALVREP